MQARYMAHPLPCSNSSMYGGSTSGVFTACAEHACAQVTLVWTDPPADLAAARQLVNDLDLTVNANSLSGYSLHGNGAKDYLNTVEQVGAAAPWQSVSSCAAPVRHWGQQGPEYPAKEYLNTVEQVGAVHCRSTGACLRPKVNCLHGCPQRAWCQRPSQQTCHEGMLHAASWDVWLQHGAKLRNVHAQHRALPLTLCLRQVDMEVISAGLVVITVQAFNLAIAPQKYSLVVQGAFTGQLQVPH